MIEFDRLEEIYTKVCKVLSPIELFHYQEEVYQTSDLKQQIIIAGKYVSLHCNNWICQDCFSTDYAELEYEIVCLDCGTIDNFYPFYGDQFYRPKKFVAKFKTKKSYSWYALWFVRYT